MSTRTTAPDGVTTITLNDGSRLSYGACQSPLQTGHVVIVNEDQVPAGWATRGTVTVLGEDASGDFIVTVRLDSGQQQDIPASEMRLAGYDWARYAADGETEAQDWAADEDEMAAVADAFEGVRA
jgi:hypothetical protein